jgi:hypothetical protein
LHSGGDSGAAQTAAVYDLSLDFDELLSAALANKPKIAEVIELLVAARDRQ